MLSSDKVNNECFKCEMALSCDIPFKRLFEQAEESMWIVKNERFVTSNQAACRQFQIRDVESFTGIHPSQISPPLQPDGTLSDIKASSMMDIAISKGYNRFEWLHQRLDGTTIPMEITLTAINFAGELALFAVGRDISHIKNTQRKLHHLANHDPLTGLANRRNFEKSIICEIAASDQDNSGFSILFIDLDNFKVINDGLGHSIGDNLLKQVALRLKLQLSGFTVNLYRLGGDEFVVVYRKEPGKDKTRNIAATINNAFELPFDVGSNTLHITSSIGIASYPEHGDGYSELLKNADAAMYKSKALGKNKFVVFDDDIAVKAEERLVLEQELRKAIDADHLVVHYQPIFSIDGKLRAAEALVRWDHPERGLVPPDQFISIAENTGVIVQLGRWIQERVSGDLKRFLGAFPSLSYVSINVSIKELQEPDFLDNLAQTVHRQGVSPASVMLEITESALMQDFNRFNSILLNIRDKGFRISIDDFGTGYSSLSYLKDLPVQQLKLDRSFVTELTSNVKDIAIVQAIVSLSNALGLETLAEGIEDDETNGMLAKMGCGYVQGYLHGKPMPYETFFSFLNNRVEMTLKYSAATKKALQLNSLL